MAKPKLVDFFCCAGGAGEGYARAGFEVVGVDIVDRPNYPHRFIKADALELLKDKDFLSEFVAAHGSPPVPARSRNHQRHQQASPGHLSESLRSYTGPYV